MFDGDLTKLKKIILSFSDEKISQLKNIRTPLMENLTNPLATKGLNPDEKAVVDEFQKTMTAKNKIFYDRLNAEEQKIIIERIKKPKVVLNPDERIVYDRFLQYNIDEVDNLLQLATEKENEIITKVLTDNGYYKRS